MVARVINSWVAQLRDELKNDIENDWQGVIIYPSRQLDNAKTRHYQELLNTSRVRRIYLDELSTNNSLGIGTIKLVIAESKKTVEMAKTLINQTGIILNDANNIPNNSGDRSI